MPDAKPPQQPSTEEIIASISRLIADDGGMREPVLGPLAKTDDILELTERLGDEEPVRAEGDPSAAGAAPVAASRGTAPQADPRPSAAEPKPPSPPGPPAPDRTRLLSEAASEAATSAFAHLGTLSSERRAEAELPIGGAGRTVEDMVHDALRPLLRSWLDAHLPSIVERLVREEIARVAGKAGLR
jgi:hypothetical protein